MLNPETVGELLDREAPPVQTGFTPDLSPQPDPETFHTAVKAACCVLDGRFWITTLNGPICEQGP